MTELGILIILSPAERLAAPLTRKRPAPDSPNSGEDDSSPNVS